MSQFADVIVNERAAGANQSYPDWLEHILSRKGFASAFTEISSWPAYKPTPLIKLSNLAREFGFADIIYKDEAGRFGLGSFKALGGAYAVSQVLARELAKRGFTQSASCAELASGKFAAAVRDITVTSATDGNHGRSVAWGARLFGCRAVVFIHENVSERRRDAIARYGAEVVRVPGHYDDAVRHAFAEAARRGWHVVQDTALGNYRETPTEITYGYGVIAQEILDTIDEPPTHVLVQAGVGGLASAICARFWQAWGVRRPRFIVFEPTRAACVAASLAAGRRTTLTGNIDSVMAGLSCGEVSELAWDVLAAGADGAVVIDDQLALQGMRILADPFGDDPPIVGGECSGGAIGALMTLAQNRELAARLGMNEDSRILLIGTEGATDPSIYRNVVGRAPEEVATA